MEYGEEENLLPSNFKNTDLVTYSEAIAATQPTPYIAAVMSRGNFKSEFTLGDSGNTSLAGTRRRRSNGKIYYNGPLKPGTNYRIFQRVFLNDEVRSFQYLFTCIDNNIFYSHMNILFASGGLLFH